MNVSAATISSNQYSATYNFQASRSVFSGNGGVRTVDTVQFGLSITSTRQSISIVLDRATSRLMTVVSDARAALGLPEGGQFDLSAEATADRIADFALAFFDAFMQNHPELGEEEGRQAFVDLVGGAVTQGVEEARGILQSLHAITGEVGASIDSILERVLERFEEFLN